MDQSIRLGKIDGVPVGMNWSILVIFCLITWELADLVLPGYDPNNSTALYWVVAFVFSVLFFASLLAHEVSHAVIAKRNGIGVRRITFWLFGGVSELESEALTPGVDFRVAVVGPVTSLALAAFFGALAWLFHTGGGGDRAVIVSALGWLAWMNLLLGIFNIVPGAPLDGGRVLRAYLWRRRGDRASAASSAARAGQAFGYVLVVLGVLEFLAVGIIGLWFVFMGWFLLAAARAEESQVVMRGSLANVHVRDVMTSEPTTFDPETSVADLVNDQLHRYRFSSYPLVGPDGHIEGLATMGRLRHVPANQRQNTRLKDIACPVSELTVGRPVEPVVDLLQRMQASPDGRALVLDDSDRLVGIVSPSDIARYVQLCMLQSQGRAARRR
jgi:Zn-dependent protease/predicted transcriptional regulator